MQTVVAQLAIRNCGSASDDVGDDRVVAEGLTYCCVCTGQSGGSKKLGKKEKKSEKKRRANKKNGEFMMSFMICRSRGAAGDKTDEGDKTDRPAGVIKCRPKDVSHGPAL
jgi:hypothetical protein